MGSSSCISSSFNWFYDYLFNFELCHRVHHGLHLVVCYLCHSLAIFYSLNSIQLERGSFKLKLLMKLFDLNSNFTQIFDELRRRLRTILLRRIVSLIGGCLYTGFCFDNGSWSSRKQCIRNRCDWSRRSDRRRSVRNRDDRSRSDHRWSVRSRSGRRQSHRRQIGRQGGIRRQRNRMRDVEYQLAGSACKLWHLSVIQFNYNGWIHRVRVSVVSTGMWTVRYLKVGGVHSGDDQVIDVHFSDVETVHVQFSEVHSRR